MLVSADDMPSLQENSMGPALTPLPEQLPTTPTREADQIQPSHSRSTSTSTNLNPATNEQQVDNVRVEQPLAQMTAGSSVPNNQQQVDNARAEQPLVQMGAGSNMPNNEQQVDNARAEQPLVQMAAGSNVPNNEQQVDGNNVRIDWDRLFSEQTPTNDFFDAFFGEDAFLQYSPLLAMEAAGSTMAANQTLPDLVTSQRPTRDNSPPVLQYPPGDIFPDGSSIRGSNRSAFFNRTMQQTSHEHHPFKGDDDWDEFIDTAKRANNWDSNDPHLKGL